MPASSSQTDPLRYRLCDFILESAWVLPELVGAGDALGADVVVHRGVTPRDLPQSRQRGVCFAAQPGALLCWLEGVARFHVTAGREIVVEAQPGAAEETVRNLLFSSPLAGLLLQRGLVPLHASAVRTPRGAVILMGGAGAGKSTLAAEFRRRGFGILSDDIAAVRVSDHGKADVLPSSPYPRLRPDTSLAAEWDGERTMMRPDTNKRPYGSGGGVLPGEGVPLAGIVSLDGGVRIRGGAVRRLGGREALAASLDALYRPVFARGLGLDGSVFAQLGVVVSAVPVFQFGAADRLRPSEMAEIILEEFGR